MFFLRYAFLIEIPIKIKFCCANFFFSFLRIWAKIRDNFNFYLKKIRDNLTLLVPRLVQNYTNQKYVETKYFQ